MTHTTSMPDSAGEFSPAQGEERFCAHCKARTPFKVERWDSNCGGYEDYKYTCTACSHGLWIEGSDA